MNAHLSKPINIDRAVRTITNAPARRKRTDKRKRLTKAMLS